MSSSEYTLNVTAACPESLTGQGNVIAYELGGNEADTETYGRLNYEDGNGVKYSVVNFQAKASIISDAESVELLTVVMPQSGEYSDPLLPASGSVIVAYVNYPLDVAIDHMGLTAIVSDDTDLI